jgi:hypothetical protein
MSDFNRCSYCNRTNSPEIATHPGDYNGRLSMTIDPRDETAIICSDCADSVMESQAEFSADLDADEWGDWE